MFERCSEFSPNVESNFYWSRITGKSCAVIDLFATMSCLCSVQLCLFKPSIYRIYYGHYVDLIIPSICSPHLLYSISLILLSFQEGVHTFSCECVCNVCIYSRFYSDWLRHLVILSRYK